MSEKKDDKEPLADGIEQVSGNLFKVKFTVINVANKPDPGGEEYQWSNIRYMTASEDSLGRGFEKPKMVRQRDSIRDEGLYYPLICRWITKDGYRTVQLVDGERRYRNIDWLILKNEKCKNPATGQYEPAKVLYESIECRVFDAPTDKEALKLAYKSGTCREDFGDEADIVLIRELRSKQWSDEDILDALGHKPEWLRDIDTLIEKLEGDEKTFSALAEGTINKTAALALVTVEDIPERHEKLDLAMKYATEEAKEKQAVKHRQVVKAKEERELARSKKVEAEHKGDTEGVQQAEQKEAAATKKVEEKQKEEAEIKPKVGGKHTDRAGAGGGGPMMLRAPKVKKLYFDVLDTAIKNEGKDSEDKFLAPVELLRAFQAVIKGVLDGEEEPTKIFRKWGARLVPAPEKK